MGLAFCLLFVLGAERASAAPENITPFLGRPGNWACRAVVLDQSNVIGFFSVPRDSQTVDAQVLFRSGTGRFKIDLRLMRDDAKVLRGEIAALLQRLRPDPIRITVKDDRRGGCQVFQITG